MEININNVFFKFKPKCEECGHYKSKLAQTKFCIYEFMQMGWPICEECGADLTIKSKCNILEA